MDREARTSLTDSSSFPALPAIHPLSNSITPTVSPLPTVETPLHEQAPQSPMATIAVLFAALALVAAAVFLVAGQQP